MVFPPLGSSDHVVVSVSNSKGDALFFLLAYDYSQADWDGFRDYLKDVPWDDIFKLGASATSSEFCELVQVGNCIYIYLISIYILYPSMYLSIYLSIYLSLSLSLSLYIYIYPSSVISGQASLISMVFSYLSYCHNS